MKIADLWKLERMAAILREDGQAERMLSIEDTERLERAIEVADRVLEADARDSLMALREWLVTEEAPKGLIDLARSCNVYADPVETVLEVLRKVLKSAERRRGFSTDATVWGRVRRALRENG